MAAAKVRTTDLQQMRERGERIVATTAYDWCFARLVDAAGVDVVLVGDSLGTVVQGGQSTVAVTLDAMVYHTKLVSRGTERGLLIADLPFLMAHFSFDEVLRAAGRLMQEGGAEAVKLEGGAGTAPIIERLVRAGIPVMGHVGLQPQRFHQLGGHKLQGKTEAGASQIVADAVAVAEAGAFAVVVEGVPPAVASAVTKAVTIPTIGIGAGPDCSGQVLVMHDLLGLHPRDVDVPRFVKKYAELGKDVVTAVGRFADEVRRGVFPAEKM